MLTYEQIKSGIAKWTGVEVVLQDMCPKSCMAFNGPFMDLEKCPYCAVSWYDEVELERSKVKIKNHILPQLTSTFAFVSFLLLYLLVGIGLRSASDGLGGISCDR
jgi:hypothetical protein